MSAKAKIPIDGGDGLAQNPFAALPLVSQNPLRVAPPSPGPHQPPRKNHRGRVDIRREKTGRGGKTVTLISGFQGIGSVEKMELCRRIKERCGTGGTVKDGHLEIQGDFREVCREVLAEAGFQVVFSGG